MAPGGAIIWASEGPVLNDFQLDVVWRDMLAAETRSLYFADLAARATRRKQWITGITLFLSSGAAAAILAKAPPWVATSMAATVAALSAYSISANLDGSVTALLKLHAAWSRIQGDYERLWSHTFSADAEAELDAIQREEQPASEDGVTAGPCQEKLLAQWQDRVNRMHARSEPHAA